MSSEYDFNDRIDYIESLDGDGTELVTLTVPANKSIAAIKERIAQEHADAQHIKSDTTRDRVQQALKRIQRLVREYAETPENGLVVYAGVIDGELESFVFDDLPRPIVESRYVCDDQFEVSPLANAVAPSETFGLIVIERGEASIGRLIGEQVIPIETFESQVMGQSRAGGQSAKRFERERERQAHEFYEKVASVANKTFVGEDETVEGVAVGGTLATVQQFVDDEYLDYRLQERVVGTHAVEYANEQGLRQLVDAAQKQLLDAEQKEKREKLEEFYDRLREGETVAYGADELEAATTYGAVDTALVASSLSRERRDRFETAVTEQGGDFYVISGDSEQGQRLASAFGGVVGLLRFPIN